MNYCPWCGWKCRGRACPLHRGLDRALDEYYGDGVEVTAMGSQPSSGSHGVQGEPATALTTAHETAAPSHGRTAPTSYRARSRGL